MTGRRRISDPLLCKRAGPCQWKVFLKAWPKASSLWRYHWCGRRSCWTFGELSASPLHWWL